MKLPALAGAGLLAALLGGCARPGPADDGIRLADVDRAKLALGRQQAAIALFAAGDYGAAAAALAEIRAALPPASRAGGAAAWLGLDGPWAYRRLLASVNNNLGLAHLRARRLPAAEERFREALEIFPGALQARINLGYARYHAADPAGALASFELALATAAADPELLLAAARSARRVGRLDEARRWLGRAESLAGRQTAIDAFGLRREAAYELGMVELELGRLAAAERAMRRALDLAPGDPKPRYRLLQVLAALERDEEAAAERARFDRDAAKMARLQAILMASPDRVEALGEVALGYEELGVLDLAWEHYQQLAARAGEPPGAARLRRDLEQRARRQLG